MITIVNESLSKSDEVFMCLFNHFSNESIEEGSMISNVHSVDPELTSDGLKNVTFDYDIDIRVMLKIHENGDVEIDAPRDMWEGTESEVETCLEDIDWTGEVIFSGANSQKPKKSIKESMYSNQEIEKAWLDVFDQYYDEDTKEPRYTDSPTKDNVINCYKLAKEIMKSVGDYSEPKYIGLGFGTYNKDTIEKIYKRIDWDLYDKSNEYGHLCAASVHQEKCGDLSCITIGSGELSKESFCVTTIEP